MKLQQAQGQRAHQLADRLQLAPAQGAERGRFQSQALKESRQVGGAAGAGALAAVGTADGPERGLELPLPERILVGWRPRRRPWRVAVRRRFGLCGVERCETRVFPVEKSRGVGRSRRLGQCPHRQVVLGQAQRLACRQHAARARRHLADGRLHAVDGKDAEMHLAGLEPDRQMPARNPAQGIRQADLALGAPPQHEFGLSGFEPAHDIEARTFDAKFKRHAGPGPVRPSPRKTGEGRFRRLVRSRGRPVPARPGSTRCAATRPARPGCRRTPRCRSSTCRSE